MSPKGYIIFDIQKEGEEPLKACVTDGLPLHKSLGIEMDFQNNRVLERLIKEGYVKMSNITNAILSLPCKGYKVTTEFVEVLDEENL